MPLHFFSTSLSPFKDGPGAYLRRATSQPDPATLRTPISVVQVPIGVDDQLEGVVDLVWWEVMYNEVVKGVQVVKSDEISTSVFELATRKRTKFVSPWRCGQSLKPLLALHDIKPRRALGCCTWYHGACRGGFTYDFSGKAKGPGEAGDVEWRGYQR
ncbi:hypothetical protein BGW80DRAFT_592245 [Lactifluus volemus]|nr:hypothetical protein BGW80DRAFT_592245 [Lactifluus volemus]